MRENNLDFYDELLAKTDIVKLISAYTPLTRKGATYWGCCPFHHEKTPSFTVSDQKQVYHCFGCGASGNAITFVKNIESVDGSEAVKILARAAGLEVPSNVRGGGADGRAAAEKRERLHALLREAAMRYHSNLSTPAAAKHNEYLAARGIDKELITKFGLGASVSGSDVIIHLKSKGFTESEMKEAGIAENKAGNWYDVFYDRLMFPIIDAFGSVSGFGGRTLKPDPDFAKYRNTSQTPVFDKSRLIYGANLLKKRKQRSGLDYIIVCEGYMDVIALHKAGFDTAVASMGTALTFAQAKQLKNFCGRVYISYDGDAAGQKATLRGLDILASAGLNVKVAGMPDGLDPDDVIKKRGREFYAGLLANASTLTAFKIETLKKSFDLTAPDEKSKFAVEAVKVIKSLENPVEREEYLSLVQKYTGYSMASLLSQAGITDAAAPAAPPVPPPPAKPKTDGGSKDAKARLFVLACLADDAPFVDYAEDFNSLFCGEAEKTLCEYFLQNKAQNAKSAAPLYNLVSDEQRELLDAALNYEFMAGDGAEKYADCVRILKIGAIEKKKNDLAELFGKTNDLQILKRINELDERLLKEKNGGNENE
ncbi:MAG: DNA primase [Clostridiales bacterium]|jgi:DNA primase|nr:DNA primase [Clostridiales bacterium]